MSEVNEQMDALEQAVLRTDQEERAAKAVSSARARLVLSKEPRSVFFATLVLKLGLRQSWDLPTAAVDGKAITYNPGFIVGLKADELIGVLAHEVLHVAMNHGTRRGQRDMETWQIACDLVVNPILTEGKYTLPAGALFPGKGKYAKIPGGLSVEATYAKLQEDRQQGPGGDEEQEREGGQQGGQGEEPTPPADPGEPGEGEGEGGEGGQPGDDGQPGGGGEKEAEFPADPGGCGSIQEPGNGSESAKTEQEAENAVAVAQAEMLAKRRGDLPAGLARICDTAIRPKVDWREVLRDFVGKASKDEYRWSPPNRRHIADGLYLPSRRGETLSRVILTVDCSGSIGQEELDTFAGAMAGIMEAYENTGLTVLYHDVDVTFAQQWEPGQEPLKLTPHGGGGTSHGPVFERIASMDEDEEPSCIVCLTDLYTCFPDRAPDLPVLWAVLYGPEASAVPVPFGQRLDIEAEEG